MMMLDSGIGAVPRLVAQHRELADRPDLLEGRAASRVAEIDDLRLERRVVLVERDQPFWQNDESGWK